MLEVRLLGKFDVKYDGQSVIISSRIAQSLFAYMVLDEGTSHRREKLAGMFWPDIPEEKARAYLRHELWRIRKALSTKSKVAYLLSDDINISFNSSAEYWSDVTTLENFSEMTMIEELMQTLSVVQGELLPGFYDEWIIQEREHLQAIFEKKMARLLELLEGEKRWQDILEWAERWISIVQGPEVAYRYLIIAYAALGDHVRVTSTYERCKNTLRALDLEPSEQTRALVFRRASKLKVPIPLTSFIGREKELKEVAGLFSKSRLITLTGSGGVGKTRLAIQVVADVLEQFPDGIWFLELATLGDPALVPGTLANLLGLRESSNTNLSFTDLLINYFRFRRSLVIFDNCEHLIDSCAQLIYSLLTSCENLCILATSRESLRVSGEIPYRVPSLETPGEDSEFTVENLSKIESVRLFTARAAFASLNFAINSQNFIAIAQICRRLDGIPLAIELAASRINLLTSEQIAQRLNDRFSLLNHGLRSSLPRHQTLRSMIEWSYDLLSEKEQILFRRLAAFMGGWTLEAAEQVCAGHGIQTKDVLYLLTQFVDKSLLHVETMGSETRYRSLETIRQFAHEKLVETSELTQLQDRHLDYFLKKVEEIEPFLTGAEQSEWMDYVEMDIDNFRLALKWSTSHERGEEALRLVGVLSWFWYIRCHFREGIEWFRRALTLREKAAKQVTAKALAGAGWLHYAVGDLSSIISFHSENLEFYRELGDMKGITNSLQFLGTIEYERGNLIQSRAYLEESLSISRKINSKATMPRVMAFLANFSQAEGDYLSAWQYYEESLAICREIQEGHLTVVVLENMGHCALSQKNIPQAREYFSEALEICLRLKNPRTIAESFLNFSMVLCAEEQYMRSAQLQGFASALFRESESLKDSYLEDIEENSKTLKACIGENGYLAEFDLGQALRLEQAIEIALKQRT
jgi:predicted ATPase/DNA-binding SARP family transcriptional activator